MYLVKIEKTALKQMKSLPAFVLEGFKNKFEVLSKDPFVMNGVETIKNPKSIGLDIEKAYRIRVENYRAIYAIEESLITITIIEIEHRSKIYRKK